MKNTSLSVNAPETGFFMKVAIMSHTAALINAEITPSITSRSSPTYCRKSTMPCQIVQQARPKLLRTALALRKRYILPTLQQYNLFYDFVLLIETTTATILTAKWRRLLFLKTFLPVFKRWDFIRDDLNILLIGRFYWTKRRGQGSSSQYRC